MSIGLAATCGDDTDDNAEREMLAFNGKPALRPMFEPTVEYAGFQFVTCGDCALIVGGEAVLELGYP